MKKEIYKNNGSLLAIIVGVVILILLFSFDKKYIDWVFCMFGFLGCIIGIYICRKNYYIIFNQQSIVKLIVVGIIFFIAIRLFFQLDLNNDLSIFWQRLIYALSMILFGVLILLTKKR